LCSALGIPFFVTLLNKLFGFKSPATDLLGAFALFSQPYFLFRLLDYYRPRRRWLHWVVLGGMVLCWVILYRYIARYPATTQVVIFGYCVVVDAFCTWEYSRGIRSTSGILRRRLLFITISAGLFTLALTGNVIKAIVPGVAPTISGIGLAATAVSAVLYYLAFIPPRSLRHAWQFEEMRKFISQPSPATGSREPEHFQELASAATQAVNGMMGAVVTWNETADEWRVHGSTDPAVASEVLANGQSLLKQAWQLRQPLSVYVPDIQNASERRQIEAVGARSWLLVPVQTAGHLWAILVVILRDRSLFVDDDLNLLELFAQQSAILQENHMLIAALQGYSEQLEAKVEERTEELQHSEAALLELNATLEQRIEQRTAELERSNVELYHFAHVAPHDLKAPLRAISHLTKWIEEDAGEALPDKAQEHLVKLRGRVNRMEMLLNDLLAYARVGSERHQPEAVDINDLIQDVTDVIAPPTGFTVKVRTEMPVVHVERTPLETVFRNLLGNAIKHHHRALEGNVEVHAQSHNGFVEFAVKDDGPGIDPEHHERIFDIFQTLAPRDQGEGSGIGLAIVKKSVESRGGTIRVQSARGEGTTFRFTWPQNGYA
jgi:signal transduction histidine kinase